MVAPLSREGNGNRASVNKQAGQPRGMHGW
jgi:hypothetical protein